MAMACTVVPWLDETVARHQTVMLMPNMCSVTISNAAFTATVI